MKIKLNTPEVKPKLIPASTMADGQVGIVRLSRASSYSKYIGNYFLKMYNGVVSLNSPGETWAEPGVDWPAVDVEVLPPGTELTITTE